MSRTSQQSWLRSRLTNGDLQGMDAGELREHAAEYVVAHCSDEYSVAVCERIANLTDLPLDDVLDDVVGDATDRWLEGDQ